VAGVEQEDARADQLVLAQVVTRFLHRREGRDQIVGGRDAACGDDLAHERAERDHGVVRGALLLGRRLELVELHDRGRPRTQLRCVLDPNAEQLADQDDGQWFGHVGNEIERRLRGHARERFLDDGGRAIDQRFDAARGERFADERAQARVLRRFVREQVVGLEAIERGLTRIGRRPAELIAREHVQNRRAEALRSQDRGDVGVAAHHHLAQPRLVEDGQLLAHVREERIGVADQIGVGKIEGVVRKRRDHER
jgi:hypothetical protein